jgi:hypothetical protein
VIRLLTICDPHLSAHNPAAWKAPYAETMLLALAGVQEQLAQMEARIDAVLVAGDFFHLKAPSRNPLGFVTRVARQFKAFGCPVYGIAGNHDLRGGSIASGGLEGQPLEALAEMGAVLLVDERERWIQDPDAGGGCGCWIQGASFDHGTVDSFAALKRTGRTPVIRLGHFGFSPKGSGELFGEKVYGPEDLGDTFDVAVIGHHHYDQGIHEINGRWYVAHGSMGWTSCHKADRDRVPQVGVIEVGPLGSVDVQALPLNYRPFEELIDVEKRDAIVEEATQLEEFTAQLAGRLLEAPDPEAVLADLELDADVRERARSYLEDAENG